MYSLTLSTNWMRARKTNTTDDGFVLRVPQHAEPYGATSNVAQTAGFASVFNISSALPTTLGAGESYNGCMIKPYAVGANNVTFKVRVWGWGYLREDLESVSQWIPTLLVEMLCTASTTVVTAANGILLTTDNFADTITLTYGNANVSNEIISTAADVDAHAVVDLKGHSKVEFQFSINTSATSCNALVKMM